MAQPQAQLDAQRLVGSLFIAGFDGTQLTSNICHLIEEHYVGAILITPKNLINVTQATKLIKDLQYAAYKAGHEYPLLIAIDQENGGCNSILGGDEICQFPSAMGVVAGKDPSRAREIAKATAEEMKCLGINWILGPVLDVVSKSGTNTLGVRMMDENPEIVAKFGSQFVAGNHEGGVASCGKHFPSYGNLEFDDAVANIPCLQDTLEDLRQNAFIPFQDAVKEGIDSIMVGACAMPNINGADVQHACLSATIVTDVLRKELEFNGVVLCECLEVESLYESVGFGQAGIMALSAGCDMLMVCNSFTNQIETIQGVHAALASDVLPKSQLQNSATRISKMKRQYTSWAAVFSTRGAEGLLEMAPRHQSLAMTAYESSITVVRDTKSVLPLKAAFGKSQSLLLLTPLLEPLSPSHRNHREQTSGGACGLERQFMKGEQTFQSFGAVLAKSWDGKVIHTSYAPSSVRPYHEELVDKAQFVIVFTADANRHSYQYGFTKYIRMLCTEKVTRPKQFVVVATSSPYDFLRESLIPTYICTYDYTGSALSSLAKILLAQVRPVESSSETPSVAGLSTKVPTRKISSVWLTQPLNIKKDLDGVSDLLLKLNESWPSWSDMTKGVMKKMLEEITKSNDATMFVVKNTSTQSIYGVCMVYYIPCISRGSIALLIVDSERRRLGIGQSLHLRAISHLLQHKDCLDIQLGSDLPALIPGVPEVVGKIPESSPLKTWLWKRGWENSTQSRSVILKTPVIEGCTPLLATDPLRWSPTFMHGKEFSQFDIVSHSTKCLAPYSHMSSALLQPVIMQEIYRCAAEPSGNVDVLIVRDSKTSMVVGSALFHGQNSSVAQYFPCLGLNGNLTGILIDPSVDRSGVLSNILLMGIERCRYLGCPSLECRLPAYYLDLQIFFQGGFQLMGEFSVFNNDSCHFV